METDKKTKQSFGMWQSTSYVFCPENYDEVKECLDFALKNGLKVALKGSAMSFSSVCLAKENAVLIDISNLNQILEVNEKTILVQGGVKIFEIIKLLLPKNKIIGALSGSVHNTVAGNIGSDINGKDSWHFGNFSSNVLNMKVMTASGEIVSANRTQNQDLFYSIIGGLGVIGIILEVKLQIQEIPSSTVNVYEQKVSDIDELMDAFLSADAINSQFLYAWLNPYAKDEKEGQGIVYSAHFTSGNSISKEYIEKYERKLDKQKIFGLKKNIFWKLMRLFYTRKIHKWAGFAKYFFQKNNRELKLSFFDFQYPMVRHLPDWNLYFYPHGFTELHILFPFNNFKSAFKDIMKLCREFDSEPFTLAVRQHKKCEGFLSFGEEGLSFTLNYSRAKAYTNKNLILEQKIKYCCQKYHGKLYLSKYPYLSKVEMQSMYPEFERFSATKNKFDKSNLFVSHAFDLDKLQ